MVGAKGQESDAGSSGRNAGSNALKGMEDAGRVVHYAVGIDGGGECLVAETLANSIGKTRAHKEDFFARLYQERRRIDGDLCTEFHHFT